MAKRFFSPIDLTGTINDAIAVPERSFKWSDDEGTILVGLKGGNVELAVGQGQVALCYNGTANALVKGQVVYISGAQGQKPSVALASANSEVTSSKTLGVVTETIQTEADGFIKTFGLIRGINTSSFSPGSPLWLSTTAGQITSTMPTPPNHSVFIGYCVKSHANAGEIFVKIQNGYEISELHDVKITTPSDGQILQYNSVLSVWENVSPPGGVNPYPTQTGNSGKFLQTNGTNVLWANVDLSSKADINSPTFTGIPLAPTAISGTNTTQIATTAFVNTEISNLINGAPTALNTLHELAEALGNDSSFATNVTNSISGKVSKSGGDTITSTSSIVPLTIQSSLGQLPTLDLFRILDSSSNVKFSIENNGYLSSYGIGAIVEAQVGTDFGRLNMSDSSISLNVFDNTLGIYSSGSITIEQELVSIQAKGSTSTSGAAMNWEPTGVSIIPNGPGVIPLTVRGAENQTALLQRWRNFNNEDVAYLTSAGYLFAKSADFDQLTVTTPINGTDAANKQYVDGQLQLAAPLSSPSLTGTPTAPTPPLGNNSTRVATTEFVQKALEITQIDTFTFDGRTARFLPTYLGDPVQIDHPLRLLLNINGIMQIVAERPSTVWLSGIAQFGYYIDDQGYIVLPEPPEAGSYFEARLFPGVDLQARPETYPFRAIDIYLGD